MFKFFKKIFKPKDIKIIKIGAKNESMKIIVGLGNPGEQYVKTRHNIGWHVIDAIKDKLGASDFRENKKFKALVSEVLIEKEDLKIKVLLVKPLTFMNLSGDSLSAIKNFYKLNNEDFTIVYDDIDLPLGELRLRDKGGPGTHNGMKSIVKHFGQSFPRLRFGIEGRTEELKKHIDLSDYVLSKFRPEEEEKVSSSLKESVNRIIEMIKS